MERHLQNLPRMATLDRDAPGRFAGASKNLVRRGDRLRCTARLSGAFNAGANRGLLGLGGG